ncbi:hypothetical protein NCAS_0F03370 [Naumovozyma castellii]|uniref:Uncharacterized protein n=1 Tax=Naumovozyma castellii TaxID=27288 RepID=G0VH49_NAUCA|nr:hypothetical protein NCAS_0F03370 [Naumovozyma castellii CBS 4309]CCC70821.1 hypothetical protein NCAS_0F03370 [Naumovozyma castellii CBS 4309]
MAHHSITLPKCFQSFFGIIPLYLGVEIVLGITIFNKCSGAYGILALFTGHPLDFVQWVFYLWSIFTLIIFAQGLYEIHKPTLLTFSQILVFYSLDTICTCIFTLWFTSQWFQTEPTGTEEALQRRNESLESQGATEAYEYMMTIFITLVTLTFRLYFNCLLAAFVQELLHHPKYLVDQDDVEQDLKNKPVWKRWWIKNQKWSYKVCSHLLA